jgi:hypothetical protein
MKLTYSWILTAVVFSALPGNKLECKVLLFSAAIHIIRENFPFYFAIKIQKNAVLTSLNRSLTQVWVSIELIKLHMRNTEEMENLGLSLTIKFCSSNY